MERASLGTITLTVAAALFGPVAFGQQKKPASAAKGAISIQTERAQFESGELIEAIVRANQSIRASVTVEAYEQSYSQGKRTGERRVESQKIKLDARTGRGAARLRFSKGGVYRLVAQGRDRSNRAVNGQQIIQITAPHFLDRRVDTHLRKWSAETTKIRSLYTTFVRTIKDPTWGDESAEGSARYLRPNKARLDIHGEESFVLTGEGELWQFKLPPPDQPEAVGQIVVFKLPPEMAKNGVQDGPLPFLLGEKPEKILARYRIMLQQETEKNIQLRIYPKWKEDKENFIRAALWLNKKTYLPDKLEFLEPGNNKVTYEFSEIWINVELDPNDFKCRRIPDWEFREERVAGKEKSARSGLYR